MSTALVIVAGLVGLAVGSFLNVVSSRLPAGQPLTGRSHCPNCRRALRAQDLIPVLSFLLRRGRCRFCRQPISGRYALVELATAGLFVLAVARSGLSLESAWLVVVGSFAIALFVVDLERQVVPDQISLPAMAAGFSLALLSGRALGGLVLGGILGAGFFALQYLLSRGRWVGDGDIRLGGFVGLALGLRDAVVALVVAYGVGALVALALLAGRRASLRSRLPFGAFLMPAVVLAALVGGPIAGWYAVGGPFHALGLDRLTDWFLVRRYDL